MLKTWIWPSYRASRFLGRSPNTKSFWHRNPGLIVFSSYHSTTTGIPNCFPYFSSEFWNYVTVLCMWKIIAFQDKTTIKQITLLCASILIAVNPQPLKRKYTSTNKPFQNLYFDNKIIVPVLCTLFLCYLNWSSYGFKKGLKSNWQKNIVNIAHEK